MKRHCEIGILLAALVFAAGTAQVSAQGSAPGPWQSFRFDFALCDGSIMEPQPCIWADGSMNYTSAQTWVQALNAYVDPVSRIVGYLGHTTWQLPTAPLKASDCSGTGPSPYREGFAFGCDTSALGFLYHTALGFRATTRTIQAISC